MMRRSHLNPLTVSSPAVVLGLILAILVAPGLAGIRAASDDSTSNPARSATQYSAAAGNTPAAAAESLYGLHALSFEANAGQVDAQVKFLSRNSSYSLFLTPTEAVLSMGKSASQRSAKHALAFRKSKQAKSAPNTSTTLRMQLLGASTRSIEGLQPQETKSNYFIGSDPNQWRTGVVNYARVKYTAVYPGIDLYFYGSETQAGKQAQLEYDFVISPGTDPHAISFNVAGVDRLELNEAGDLVMVTARQRIQQRAPSLYQDWHGERKPVAGRYVVKGNHQFGFEVGPYDSTKALVIDPVIDYSTLLSGSGADQGAAIAVDGEGYSYITGMTDSLNFPTSSGAFSRTPGIGKDAFVTKFNRDGSNIIYSTYLGGGLDDEGYGIAVDALGQAYVTGTTASPNFPTTAGALLTVNSGGTDAFVTKLSANGSSLVYSTYLGGSGFEEGFSIAVNRAGNAYVTGVTGSTNFPTSNSALQTTLAGPEDAFVTKLNPTGSAVVYSTFLGGNNPDMGFGIALDQTGANAFVTGITDSSNFPTTAQAFNKIFRGSSDAFATELNDTGTSAVYSTYLGGSGTDAGLGIAVDSSGAAYVVGATDSTNFQVTASVPQPANAGGGTDAFVTKLSVNGSLLTYSAYLGGSGADAAFGVALDPARNAYVTGTTSSANFPTVAPATVSGGGNDAFLTKVSADGSALMLSRYFGGLNNEDGFSIAVDLASNVYITGATTSNNFATTTGAFQTAGVGGSEAFVTKLTDVSTSTPIDDARFFVQQHYLDFLSRLPDTSGWDYWTGQITQCGTDPVCLRTKRIDVSNAFYFELEFQQTGSYVYRVYRVSFGNNQPFSNPHADPNYPGEDRKLPLYTAFAKDRAQVRGGSQLAQLQLALANDFAGRPEFLTKYPASLSGPDFVDAVLTTVRTELGADLTAQRDALIGLFNSGGRGNVIYRLADDNAQTNPINNRALIDAEYNRAFVYTQYAGYLRRNSDVAGFLFWLGQVNGAPLRDVPRQHAMVCSFMTSTEYQKRFSSVVTHSNSECQ